MSTGRRECGRIYVNAEDSTKFMLKCFYCRSEFMYWKHFFQHIQNCHLQLKKVYMSECTLEEASPLCNMQLKDENSELHETEIVLIAEDKNLYENEATTPEGLEIAGGFVNKCEEPLVNLKVEILAFDFMQQDNKCDNEDEIKHNKKEEDNEDNKPNFDDVYVHESKGDTTTQPSSRTHLRLKKHAAISKDETQIKKKFHKTEANKAKKRKTLIRFPQKERTCNRVFYHMRDTEPEVMLDFIDIIQRHPCHWNPSNCDYAIKEKRDESAEQICVELQEKWNIDITPQVARNSVLQLCHWFEREYLRAEKCKIIDDNRECKEPRRRRYFCCAHPDYYKKLFDFLPRKHLKMRACDECDRVFKTEPLLLSHKHIAHNGAIPYQCGYCNRGFAHVSSLRHHENRHTKERVWPCVMCDYKGSTKTDHSLHMITHTDIRAYVCKLCGAAYKSSTSLNVHKRSHEPPRLKCERCGKLFRENYRLKRHMWQHETTDKAIAEAKTRHVSARYNLPLKYCCKICLKRFKRIETLQCHERLHATPPKMEKAVESKYCVDNVEYAVFEHELVEEFGESIYPSNIDYDDMDLEDPEDDDETFSCAICEVEFISLNALRTHHMRMHNMVDI